MKKQISMLLAIVMLLSIVMVPGVFSFTASAEETTYPVEVKVHYQRDDGNFEGWNVFQWGGVQATAFEVNGTEAVATIYANSNSGDIGFIVRYSTADNEWADREWVNADTGDRTVTGLSDIVTGTVHVYVDHANPAETTIVYGDDVIRTGEERIDIRVHYIRDDANYEGWNVFQWGGKEVSAFEVAEDGSEAVATITAYSNSGDVGFIVRYSTADNEWADREWVNADTGDRTVTGLSGIFCGTVDVYVDHANPTETIVELGTVAYGTGEAPEYDITLNVHYYREDGDYSNWEVHMWNGVESLDSTRKFAEDLVEHDGKQWAVATYYADASDTWVGFIIKTPDWTKDPDGDRHIDISDVTGGTVNVYAVSGSALEDFVTDKTESTLGAKVTAAVYDYKTSTIEVTTSYPIENPTVDTFTLEGPDGQMTISAIEVIDETTYKLTYEGTIDEMNVYTLYYNDVACVVTIPNTYSTEEFEAEYTYKGNDLGATWTKNATTFRLWAPTAAKVLVNLYTAGNDGEKIDSIEMTPDVNGTWVATVEGDLNGTYYTYSVTRKGETVEAVDPYARTTGVNGNRGMVIDLDSTDPAGWENDTYVTQDSYTDAVIWELHVRDFSIDETSGMENKGKYLAFTELGTTVPGTDIATGVDYMTQLGVNYVHLLPVYDINSVDENAGGYNWGYDPKNYNVPEGSYSTDPYNGAVRVTEFKQMVQSLHDNGIGVIMDVVYNHVADAGNFCFNQIVPGYFSRIHDDGSYQSNSGCGNDTASERSMVSKYIVDSVLYWCEEYHIDGFRWDLVGLIDYETINAVMEAVHAVNPEIIFYGEGWEMCTWTTKDGYVDKMTIQPNDAKVNTEDGIFAFFNDTIRNVIHGGVFTATDKGFVSGNLSEGTKKTVTDGYLGNSTWGSDNGSVDTPLQTVNYASCHDNYTLFDNLTIDVMDAKGVTAAEAAAEAAAMNNLAAAYYITAQGVPFIHAGEEMLRSKPDAQQENGFNHNSYASGDAINSIKWGNLADELVDASHDYYQGLIAFRAAHPALRMTTEAEIQGAMSALETGSNDVIAVINNGGNGEEAVIVSIFNAATENKTVALPEGKWNVYVNKAGAGTETLATVEGEVRVEATSAMILVKAAESSDDDQNQEICSYDVARFYGDNRTQTAFMVADAMKHVLDVDTFDSIIIASGYNFADALAGSYLASAESAPILLYYGESSISENVDYITENLTSGGTVYILGGTAAVPQQMEDALTAFQVERLWGETRFETNLAILEKVGVEDQEILITDGWNYADALAGSATGLPILVVNSVTNELTIDQLVFLTELESNNDLTILGGVNAVSAEIENHLKFYGNVSRVYGQTREYTAIEIAKRYFPDSDKVCLAFSRDFPDALCGGALANAAGAPLLLTNAGYEEILAAYLTETGTTQGYVMGGPARISDNSVKVIFGITAEGTFPSLKDFT